MPRNPGDNETPPDVAAVWSGAPGGGSGADEPFFTVRREQRLRRGGKLRHPRRTRYAIAIAGASEGKRKRKGVEKKKEDRDRESE